MGFPLIRPNSSQFILRPTPIFSNYYGIGGEASICTAANLRQRVRQAGERVSLPQSPFESHRDGHAHRHPPSPTRATSQTCHSPSPLQMPSQLPHHRGTKIEVWRLQSARFSPRSRPSFAALSPGPFSVPWYD